MNARRIFVPALLGLASSAGCQVFVSSDIGKPIGASCQEDDECQGVPCHGGRCTIGCTESQQCIDRLGDNHVCRKSGRSCVSLLAKDCPRVVGNYKSDDAVIYNKLIHTMDIVLSAKFPDVSLADRGGGV